MADCVDTSSDPEAGFRSTLASDPFDAEALTGLASSILFRGRPGEAIALFAAAAEIAPSAQALCRVAVALQRAGLRAEAESRLRTALAVDADCAEALRLLGDLLRGDARLTESEAVLRRGVALWPEDEALRTGLVSTLVEQGNAAYHASGMERAEGLYRQALDLSPNLSVALTNLGNALAQQLRFPEAMEAYRAAVASDTENHGAWFAMSLALLLQGDLEEGFRLFEHRRKMPGMAANFERRPEIPVWQPGESLAGKRVLVTAEQGAGDIFQSVRFVPDLAQQASAVVLEAPWTMAGVFGALSGVERVVELEKTVSDCDVSIPVMSLPLLLGGQAAAEPPYLAPVEERVWRWQAWLDRASPERRVGLVFAGDTRHPGDHERSVTLETYRPLLSAADTSFVVVQPWMSDADWDVMDDVDNVRFPGAALTDWADTAALLSLLDLVITVDTAAAHLAGALGRPVWTLLPYCPDWRWLLGRSDSPWYPSMRLYRQDRRGDWESVIQRLREDLAVF
jgi:tetratricopeptide (TPR) repeat protein